MSLNHSKFEGIFHSVQHVNQLGLTGMEILHWCNNEAAVDKCRSPLWSPRAMVQPDADILLAIHHVCQLLLAKGTTVTCRHIYCHQDTRTPKTPAVFTDQPTLCIHTLDDTDNADTGFLSAASATIQVPTPSFYQDTPTMINIACNKLATETSGAALQGGTGETLPPTLMHPLPGSKALLHIGDTWITSDHRRHILWERWAYSL